VGLISIKWRLVPCRKEVESLGEDDGTYRALPGPHEKLITTIYSDNDGGMEGIVSGVAPAGGLMAMVTLSSGRVIT
jgi:hypothetical protein